MFLGPNTEKIFVCNLFYYQYETLQVENIKLVQVVKVFKFDKLPKNKKKKNVLKFEH